MAATKIQRSFYLTEDQVRWIKVKSAERGMTSSGLVGELVDVARGAHTTDPAKIKAQGKNIHNVLAKIAKQ